MLLAGLLAGLLGRWLIVFWSVCIGVLSPATPPGISSQPRLEGKRVIDNRLEL